MNAPRLCERCSALVPLKKEPPCAACVAAGAKLPEPPWALGFAQDRRECVVCTASLSLPAPESVRVCAGHKAALERALGLAGDADFNSRARPTVPTSRAYPGLWVIK